MDIFNKVKEIIIEELNCDPQKVTLEASLKEDLGADSIDAVQIVMDLEEAFNISIEEDNADSISTVGNLVDYIKSLI